MASTATQAQGTVAGFFDSEQGAQRAMDELLQAGFRRDQIGLAVSSGTGTGSAIESGDRGDASTATGTTRTARAEHATEGVWDKVKGFFTGNEAEPYAGEQQRGSSDTREITDDGVYDGTGYADAGHDAVHHSLSGMAVPTERASYFGGRFGRGDQGAVLTVSAGDRVGEAETILERNGADLGNDTSSVGSRAYDATAGRDVTTAGLDAASEQNIKLYGEVLRVHKDRISRGEVRLRKEVVTDTQTIQVPVTREELVIERVAGTGEAVAAGQDAFSGQEIRVPLSEERASVDKQAVVEEEVRVGKREVGSTESFNETVRHEKLDVDDETKSTTGNTSRASDKF